MSTTKYLTDIPHGTTRIAETRTAHTFTNKVVEISIVTIDARREKVQALMRPYRDKVDRAKRVYFDNASFALGEKHGVEFEIKTAVSVRYGIPFRSVVFAGSAQLGFSPHQDTEFVLGSSDLDVACIDSSLFQTHWAAILKRTRAFQDETAFYKPQYASRLKDQLLRRGMILFDYLPNGPERTQELGFLDTLSIKYREYFSRISLAVYINENAFCWKQVSALSEVMGD